MILPGVRCFKGPEPIIGPIVEAGSVWDKGA